MVRRLVTNSLSLIYLYQFPWERTLQYLESISSNWPCHGMTTEIGMSTAQSSRSCRGYSPAISDTSCWPGRNLSSDNIAAWEGRTATMMQSDESITSWLPDSNMQSSNTKICLVITDVKNAFWSRSQHSYAFLNIAWSFAMHHSSETKTAKKALCISGAVGHSNDFRELVTKFFCFLRIPRRKHHRQRKLPTETA